MPAGADNRAPFGIGSLTGFACLMRAERFRMGV
jgi:hypothetical protein